MARIKEKVLEDNEDIQKFIILLTDANDEPIQNGQKLQKLMFLLADKLDYIKEQTSYDAERNGPYSEIVDEELIYLEQVGLVSIDKEVTLTSHGKSIAREMKKDTPQDIIKALKEYKNFLNDLPDKELQAYFDTAHPDMTVHTKNISASTKHHILSLIKKEKISSQCACELLNKSLPYINKQMKRR